MRVLVTGATGFLGSHIVDQLLSGGHQVRALVRSSNLERRDVEVVPGDVTDAATLAPTMSGCDAVIHCAAMLTFRTSQAPRQRQVNVEGTRNVVHAAGAAGVRRLVYTSSVAALGRPNGTVAGEGALYDWPVGLAYNESKRDAEAIVRAAPLETISLNPALVLGPGERYRHLLPLFRLSRWGLLRLVPAGGTTLCDVRDVAAAHVTALERGTPGQRYILGGPQLSFVELGRELAAATGGAVPRGILPEPLLRLALWPAILVEKAGLGLPYSPRYAPYLTTATFYSSERAVAELGYRTRPAAETIGDAAAWYRAEGLLS